MQSFRDVSVSSFFSYIGDLLTVYRKTSSTEYEKIEIENVPETSGIMVIGDVEKTTNERDMDEYYDSIR